MDTRRAFCVVMNPGEKGRPTYEGGGTEADDGERCKPAPGGGQRIACAQLDGSHNRSLRPIAAARCWWRPHGQQPVMHAAREAHGWCPMGGEVGWKSRAPCAWTQGKHRESSAWCALGRRKQCRGAWRHRNDGAAHVRGRTCRRSQGRAHSAGRAGTAVAAAGAEQGRQRACVRLGPTGALSCA